MRSLNFFNIIIVLNISTFNIIKYATKSLILRWPSHKFNIRYISDDHPMFTRWWFSIRYTMVEKPLYIFKRFSNGCSAAVKSSSNRYHLERSITYPWPYPLHPHGHGHTHCNHIPWPYPLQPHTMAVPTTTTWSWPYPLQPHDHGRTHCNHIPWPYPSQPHGHGRTHCNHISWLYSLQPHTMAVPTATT